MPEQYQVAGRSAAEICASVEAAVRDGALSAGQPLPAVRTLAGQLGVSPATVAKAYQALRQRGVIATAGRNGTRVRSRPPLTARDAPPIPAGVRDLSTGGPDPRLLPDYGPALRELTRNATSPVGYGDAGPVPALIEAARARLAADGVPLAGAAVTVTHGALDGIDRLLAAHLRPGDRVAVEDPGWANLLDLIAALGLEPVPVPVDHDGPTPDGLRAALDAGAGAAVLTARAHNPTGVAIGAARAAALRDVLGHHPDVLLIEDDYAAELSADPLHTLAGASPLWALVRSVSKPYGPDLRLAVLAADAATAARVTGRMRIGAGWVSTLLQRLVVALWRDDAATAMIARAGQQYATRRAALVAALAARGVPTHGDTGINVWVPVPDETRAVAALREHGYAVAAGARFRIASAPGIRITIAPLTLDDVGPLADAVAAALETPTHRPFTA